MSAQLIRSLVALAPVSALLVVSGISVRHGRTVGSVVQLIGAACLGIVVVAHVCEALDVLPSMHWGQPHSVGHYVDLWSAVLGFSLVATGYLLTWVRSRHLTRS